MNQARSPFAEAVLRAHFPDLQVTSAGVFARRDSRYLEGVVGIARRWGLEMRDGFSRELTQNQNLQDTDLVICAEDGMRQSVLNQGYQGKIVCFEEVVPDPSFMPQDPEMMRGRMLEAELAKVAWINVQSINASLQTSNPHSITAVIPDSEQNVELAISWALAESKNSNALILDADVRAPLARAFRKMGLSVRKFDSPTDNAANDVLSNMSEDDHPERRLISRDWSLYISNLARTRPVIMVTAPQSTEIGPLPDSFLAAIPASRIKIIRT
jgi:protein-tyrosine phosphatase